MSTTQPTFHWPWHVLYTARRYPLTDPKRIRVSTTAASLLNFALSFGGDQAGPSTERGRKDTKAPLAIYHSKSGLSVYFESFLADCP